MQETEHYKLKKPGESDYADVAVLNENMDAVEAALDGLEKGKAGLDPATGKVKPELLPPMNYDPAGSAGAVDAKLTAHTGDGVKHVTAAERTAWNGKETPAGAQAKADAAEAAAKAASRPAAWTPTWGEVTDKPGTFPPGGHQHNAGDVTSGILPAARGGTGYSTLQATRNAMGLGNTTGALPVVNGGTGATTAASARTSLGAAGIFGPVTVSVAVGSWAGSGPWTQTVSVSGVVAADNGLGVFPVDVADAAARKLYEKAYGCLAAEADTVAGGIKLTCRDAKPETTFQVVVKGVK